jgi:EmrB/QacA subfamily drug resistance transporter
MGASTAGGAQRPGVVLASSTGRWLLATTVLASSVALLDTTVVNVALPAIGRDLDASFGGLQWTVNGYTLTLAALILLGGSLGDRYGRRRVLVVGAVWFGVASVLCGLATNVELLVVARLVQGVGAALLIPGSLALLSASLQAGDRGRAIGSWSALGGIAAAVGPLAGGLLVEVSWRLAFLVNVPVCAAVAVLALRHVPESRDDQAPASLDVAGAGLTALGLGALAYGLVAAGEDGLTTAVAGSLLVGLAALGAFVLVEHRSAEPMLPLGVFASRDLRVANLVTFCVYAALGGVFLLLVVHLQVVGGFSPVAAGMSLLPVTAAMLVLSPHSGAYAEKHGARLPMTAGPLLCAVGTLLMLRIGVQASYAADVLPAVVVFGTGLGITVAPLTAVAIGAADDRHAGLASGVNNAVARSAGLLAVAGLPAVSGLTGGALEDTGAFTDGFRVALLLSAGLLAAGGVLSLALRAPSRRHSERTWHCTLDAPPLERDPSEAHTGAPGSHDGTRD